MNNVTGNFKWAMVFENNPVDNVAANSEIAILVNKSMDAWHKSIEEYSHHSNEECWAPYRYNERTTSGLFATAIAKHIPLSGAVMMELPAYKKNVKAGGRTDIVWIDQNNTVGIDFELKQKRVNIEEKDIKGELKSIDPILKEIKDAFFHKQKGLVAQSIRDFGEYQGQRAKRLDNKSHDEHYHVGLLFCPVKLNNSILNKCIKEKFKEQSTFEDLRSEEKYMMLDENKNKKLINQDLGKLYSCVYLCRPHEKDTYSLITAVIVFRYPKQFD